MAELEANFTLNNEDNIDALFEIYATGTTWGNIDGSIENQTDLYNTLTDLAGGIESNHQAIGEINTTIGGYGDIVTYNAADFATSSQGQLADTALQPNDNISELNNDVGYITSASLPTVNNATITIQKNGSTVESFTLNQSSNETINITVPTSASDIGALPNSTTIEDLTTTAQLNALNSGATTTNIGQISTNANDISDIQDLIPNQASESNQLADKNFVNSSIATNTANFIGTFNSVAELEAYSGTLTNNDYAFVETTDSAGNTLYDRYKYTTATNPASWQFEYELNNSSFTSNQWAAINSGITSSDVTAIGTALQPNDNITQLTNNAGYITSAAISSLTDVDLTNLSNGEGLIYNANSQKWENGTLATSATWGNITGTLSDQTDLQDALDTKQNELIAGTNISITDNTGGVTTVTGTESVTLDSAVNNSISNVTLSGLCVQADTPTPSTPADIACNNGIIKCNRIINRYGGSINESGVIVSNSNYAINVAPVEANKTYTVYGMSVYALFTELPVIGSTSYNNSRVVSGANSITIPNDSTIKYIAIRTTAGTLGAIYSNDELIYTDGNIETITDDVGNTATAKMLLSVGDYTDEQSIIDGAISREVGVIVFDGTESWSYDSTYERFTVTITDLIKGLSNRKMPLFCSHYPAISDGRSIASVPYNSIYGTNTNSVFIKTADYTTEEGFKTFLAQQYQSGTPLILVYPLNETTTTTVTGQDINVNTGDNRIVITQSGVNNLPISATYTKYDTSTISFVNNTGLLQNTSTGTQTITIDGTPTNQQQSINIGAQSSASATVGIALGFDAQINKSGAVCMGYSSRGSGVQALGLGYRGRATANYAIQLGYGTNSTASTLAVGFNNTNYQLLDGTTGKIPNARLNTLVGADGTNAGAEGIVPAPTATDNTKFLRGDGTWATAGGGTVDQTFDGTSTNAQSGTAVAEAISTKQNTLTFSTGLTDTSGTITVTDYNNLLKNTSTGLQALTIQGTATNQQQSINIGAQSSASATLGVALGFDAQSTKSGCVAVGYGTRATGSNSSAYGYFAKATGNYAIQLGYGTNSTASTFAVGFNGTNYQLLDGTTGKIPNARLNELVGADGTNAGTAGIVPAPTATDNTKFLRGDGTWATAGGGTVDQTYDATSTNAQSGTAVAGAISTKQNTLIAGDDIHFTTTVGLPYDYTEVASITNAATTYLDTKVRLTKDDAIMEIHFTVADASGSFYLWQQRSTTSGNILGISGSATGSTITMNVGGTAITSDIARTAGHTYFLRATYNSGNGTLYVKDETTGTEATNTGTYTWGLVNKDLHLFGNGLNSSQTCVGGITVDYMKLTVDGKVTFNGCFAVNSSNVAGVYNVIARTFRTAGIGSVTAGAVLNKPRDVIYASGFLKNTATTASSSGTLTILGNPSSNTQGVNIGTNSQTGSAYVVAVGWNAKGLGQYSTAIGRSTTSSGQNSTALGSGASASGAYSTIVGSNSGATGNSAVAIGINAKANADYAIQLGNGTNATASTMQVSFNGSDYVLLDGTTGKIPYARLPYDNSTITVNSNNQLQAITRNIGEIVASTIPLTDAGLHLLDGALISGSGSYSAFVDYIADLYDSGNYDDIFDTEANWQSAVTTYGVCGKFVYDSVNSTVRLPKITGFTEGTIDPTVLGDLVQAGLPNITGEWSPSGYRLGASSSYDPAGALYKESSSGDRTLCTGTGNAISLKFDASRSNSIYGNSTTVQPQAIKVLYYIVVATSTKTAIQVDIDEIATDLNGKADTDGSNMISSVKNFDGAWNVGFRTVIVEGATFSSETLYTYDISSALPQDNYNYDVMVQFSSATGATSGNGMYVFIASDIGGSAPVDTTKMTQILRIRAVNSSSQYGATTVVYPVGTQRKLYFYSTAAASVSNVIIDITGYRRLGTNS